MRLFSSNAFDRGFRFCGKLVLCMFLATCGGTTETVVITVHDSRGTAQNGSGGTAPNVTAQDGPGLYLLAGAIGGSGSIDGTGTASRFDRSLHLATDASDNLYVADQNNHRIRKITPAGVVITLAGDTPGEADGAGTAARFNTPKGIAVDAAGNVYVTSSGATIRKITPAGVVTTLAGSAGNLSANDGTGAAATFNNPGAIAIDAGGNLYVADSQNRTIRKITPAGVVTTLAGSAGVQGNTDGTGAGASFNMPMGITIDAAGDLYVTDLNATIRKVTQAGVVTTLAGSTGKGGTGSKDGIGTSAQFAQPLGITATAAGDLYVVDGLNNNIRKIAPGAVVTTFAGTPGINGSADGTGAAAEFFSPWGITSTAAGDLYVTDTGNSTIRKVTLAGVVTTYAGMVARSGYYDGTGAVADFKFPRGVTADAAGNVYVADTANSTIRKVTPAGVVTTLAGTVGSQGSTNGIGAAARFRAPQGLAADASGTLYVADTDNNLIRKVSADGKVTTFAGTGTEGSTDGKGNVAEFFRPAGITVDAVGNVYVADTNNSAIRKITAAGVVSTFAGTPGSAGNVDATGGAARFSNPTGITVDSAGNLFVGDLGNRKVRKITSAGTVSTLAASFTFPGAVGADGAGNLYVFDSGTFTISKITPSGTVTTEAGIAGQRGIQPGSLPASLSSGSGLAVIDAHTLALTSENSVLKLVLP